MCDIIERQNDNDCVCTAAINTKVNIENNLQLESFRSLFKLFRDTTFVYKFVEKLKYKTKIKIKQVENKIEKIVPNINLGIINTQDINAASIRRIGMY